MSDSTTINKTISEIESISNRRGLDIAVTSPDFANNITLCFTKTVECFEDDENLIDECREFIHEVVLPVFLRHEESGSVGVDIQGDEEEEDIVYVVMTLPKSEYIVEAIKTYIEIAHSVDSFLTF